MAMSDERTPIPPETLLPACPERPVGLSLPLPISARLDQLVELAEQAGERTSRKEIIASCILGAPDGPPELIRWLRLYRSSSAESVYTAGPKLVDALAQGTPRPGPRSRQWRSQSQH